MINLIKYFLTIIFTSLIYINSYATDYSEQNDIKIQENVGRQYLANLAAPDRARFVDNLQTDLENYLTRSSGNLKEAMSYLSEPQKAVLQVYPELLTKAMDNSYKPERKYGVSAEEFEARNASVGRKIKDFFLNLAAAPLKVEAMVMGEYTRNTTSKENLDKYSNIQDKINEQKDFYSKSQQNYRDPELNKIYANAAEALELDPEEQEFLNSETGSNLQQIDKSFKAAGNFDVSLLIYLCIDVLIISFVISLVKSLVISSKKN